MRVTIGMLTAKGARCHQLDRFRALFGERDVSVNRENIMKARELDLNWFAATFLPPSARRGKRAAGGARGRPGSSRARCAYARPASR